MSTTKTVAFPLPDLHGADCPVCGGGRMRVASMRRRGGDVLPAWLPARVTVCPLSSGSDVLRSVLGVSGSAPVGPGAA